MAHQIENANGRDMFVGAQDAWHRLGQVTGEDFDFERIKTIRPEIASSLTKRALVVAGTDSPVESHAAIVRDYDQKVVGVVGSEYGLVTPEEAYEWASAISEYGEIPLVSAGNLRGGSQFFFTLRMGTEAPAGIEYTPYVSVVSSHDGSQPLQAIFSPTIVVCANTLALAQSNAASKVTLRHTSRIQDRMDIALETLRTSLESVKATNSLMSALAGIRVPSFTNLLDELLPLLDEEGARATRRANTRGDIRALMGSEMVNDDLRNTAWAFVQGVNTWENWVKPSKRSGSGDDPKALRQFDAATGRSTQSLTSKAISLALAI